LGPLGAADRVDNQSNILCQFPLCNMPCFIYDQDLKVYLCDLHAEVNASQLKLATIIPNYKSSARGIQHFFTKLSTDTEIMQKTSEINKDMELDCNRKRKGIASSIKVVMSDCSSNVSGVTTSFATVVTDLTNNSEEKKINLTKKKLNYLLDL
jgi:23S rRNA U2552 (ribose-2'-O)-methylase RlmE/FtsJ